MGKHIAVRLVILAVLLGAFVIWWKGQQSKWDEAAESSKRSGAAPREGEDGAAEPEGPKLRLVVQKVESESPWVRQFFVRFGSIAWDYPLAAKDAPEEIASRAREVSGRADDEILRRLGEEARSGVPLVIQVDAERTDAEATRLQTHLFGLALQAGILSVATDRGPASEAPPR